MDIDPTTALLNMQIFSSFGAYVLLVFILFPGYVLNKIIGNTYFDSLFSIIEGLAKKSKKTIGKEELLILHFIGYLISGFALLMFIDVLLYGLLQINASILNPKRPGVSYDFLFIISSLEYASLVLLYIHKKNKINFLIGVTTLSLFLSDILKFRIVENISNVAIWLPLVLIITDELVGISKKHRFDLKKWDMESWWNYYFKWFKEWIVEYYSAVILVTAISLIFYSYLFFQPFSPSIGIRHSFNNSSISNVKNLELYIINNGNDPVIITDIKISDGLINSTNFFVLPNSSILEGHSITLLHLNYTIQKNDTFSDKIEIVTTNEFSKWFTLSFDWKY